jgi:carboxypeptidase PM20D1
MFLAMNPKTATLVRTTTAVTVFHSGIKSNVLPGEAYALVNHRIHPNDTIQG